MATGATGQILDRTVAVVGARPITASEVELQIRLQAMFNAVELDLSAPARKAALDRLVEQRLIEFDMTQAGVVLVEAGELDEAFRNLRSSAFGRLDFGAALERYGLSVPDVRDFLHRQLRFARYVEFRFRAGLQAGPDEIERAYRERFEGAPPPQVLDETLREELRRQALDARAERMLDERIRQLRSETRVAFLEPIRPEGLQ